MEFREYYAIVRKWWWLLVLCTVLGAGSAYLVSISTEPTYEASSLLMIGSSIEQVDPSTGDIQTSQKLALTYAELVTTRTILDEVVAKLDLPKTPSVNVSMVSSTQLMRITVSDSDPARAAAVANELAEQLILQSPSAPQRQQEAYRDYVYQQLADLQDEMDSLSKAIVTERESTGDMDRIARLEAELNTRRANYSSLLSYIKGGSVNDVRIFEYAVSPTVPTKPKVMQNTMLAAVVGLMLAAGAAFLIEYLDDTIKDQRDIEQVLNIPTLGVVARFPDEDIEPALLSVRDPRSPLTEAFRMIRTNLSYSLPATEASRTFLITSAGPTEGKSTVLTNLAAVMAQAGQRVLVVDSDLRRPRLHRVFDIDNTKGLSSYLVGWTPDLDDAIFTTDIAGVQFMPSGPIPPNAAELLDSQRMQQMLEDLSARFDVILMDSPPLLAVADAAILARMASGVVMVVEAGATRLEGALGALAQLQKAGAKILGAVINGVRIRRRGAGSGYYYYYYYYYYYASEEKEGKDKKKSWLPKWFPRRKKKRHHHHTSETAETGD